MVMATSTEAKHSLIIAKCTSGSVERPDARLIVQSWHCGEHTARSANGMVHIALSMRWTWVD